MAAQGQGANPYRVRAYHRAATTRRWLGRPVPEMLQQEGVEGLRKLPGLGESLTRTTHDLVVTGSGAVATRPLFPLRVEGVPPLRKVLAGWETSWYFPRRKVLSRRAS